jgi:hypothetical protein
VLLQRGSESDTAQGASLGVAVGVNAAVGVAVAVEVAVGVAVAGAVAVAVGVDVGVGLSAAAQYLPPVFNWKPIPSPPQTIISLPVHTAV